MQKADNISFVDDLSVEVVVASGYFDPLHYGHIEYLQRSRERVCKLRVTWRVMPCSGVVRLEGSKGNWCRSSWGRLAFKTVVQTVSAGSTEVCCLRF